MKAKASSFILALLMIAGLLRTSPAQNVQTVYPLSDGRNTILMDQAEGRWFYEFFGPDTITIKKAGDNFYHLRLSADAPFTHEGRFSEVDGITLFGLSPVDRDPPQTEGYHLALNAVFKVHISKDTFRFAELNYPWFYNQIQAQSNTFRYLWKDNSLVLTGSSPELRDLIITHARDSGFFDETSTLVRIGPMKDESFVKPTPQKPNTSKADRTTLQPHTCIPSFPLQNGWLGGDGDVSVPLSHNKTLWLFSDMISNSAAIMQCDTSGHTSVQYYWNNMYTQEPGPIFESHTPRYLYWINDAFLHDGVLYVLLQKTRKGRSQPSPPDDLFNFEQMGWTLARVTNVLSAPPNQWDIEYIPWSHVFSPTWEGQVCPTDSFIYTFTNLQKDSATLMRFPTESLENPEDQLQYYTKGKQWAKGFPAEDAAILFTGMTGQTLRYFPDLGQWMMIIGPGFMNAQIRMRTAPDIIGPWSDERVIYKTPEQTYGHELYDEDALVYLAREHRQFYNPNSKTLLVTYDVNSIDFFKLVNDNSIYTPRVIRIQIPDP